MRKFYFLILLVTTSICFAFGQNYTSLELIKAWKISDKTQTLEAEKTYDDLRINYNSEKFKKIISEINQFNAKNPDLRIELRSQIYEILGDRSDSETKKNYKEEKIKSLFEKTFALQDKQLLSEVYSLYAEQGPGNIEGKLFYNTSATEIQEEIGSEYFPKLYLRYISLSMIYYGLDDFEKSLKNGYQSLNLLKNRSQDVYGNCSLYDIMGACFFELNQPDSGIIYYKKIKYVLASNKKLTTSKPTDLKENELRQIWEGVANGGIARGLILQENPDDAIQLLNDNLNSSKKFEQLGDIAKAQNLLAAAYYKKGEIPKAISFWHETLKTAKQLPDGNRYLIYAADNLSKTYKTLSRFDSAYYYLNLKFQYENLRLSKISQSRLYNVSARLKFVKMDNEIKDGQLTIQKQNSTRNFILAAGALFLFIIIFSYSRYRLKQAIKIKNLEIQQKISEIEKQKIEDELNSAKSNIQIFINKVNEKNELIESISNNLKELKSSETKEFDNALNELRNTKIITDDDWISFQSGFEKVYKDFSKNLLLNFPTITPAELRYLMMTKIGLSHKEMARALGISNDAVRVTWNRVRNKLGGTLVDTPQTLLEKFNLEK